MVLTALRGGLSFLTRLPVGSDEGTWEAFRRSPGVFPLVGYVVGALAAIPLLLPLPVATGAAGYLVTLYLLTGVTHADGLADLGDAAVVHGDADHRLDVLKDSQTGVGGALALGVTLVVLALGALGLAGASGRIGLTAGIAIAIAAEVGAKVGMAMLVCLGTPAHEGLGSALVGENDRSHLFGVAVACLPLVLLAARSGGWAVLAAFACGPLVALAMRSWGQTRLGGVSGDLIGATNELSRAAAIHTGVVVWTLF
ncbi:adenosylcobinamide-GDP ribazoletransferase [Haloferax sp. DFSO60]|uniref:adenosylcobinamide-GDP ribazoletransferase n=1 Tax=Haloferax sp. DFSO60 TaxID=3388652 RepID=UPI003979F983